MKFFNIQILGDPNDESLCMLDRFVQGLERDDYKVMRGKRFGADYPADPADARIFMSPDRRGMKLCSLIGNTHNMLVVSSQFKAAIEKHCQGVDIEYLPFTLYDHRKRVHSRDYFIINPIGTFDCLDEAASGVKYGSQPDFVIGLDELVLDRNKVKDAPQLFRVKQKPAEYIIGVELGREMFNLGLTNIVWKKLRFADELGKTGSGA
ncbi:imm11 family protein [Pyxidicoccus sp. 3LG]